MGENLVLDHGGVVVYENEFDGKRRDLSYENTTEGIRNRCIDTDQGERRFESFVTVEFDAEILLMRKE